MERIRQAVIVADTAAGALLEVAGLPLIKRALLTLGRAGFARVDVICATDAGALRTALEADPDYRRHCVTVTVAPALADATTGPVLVVTADHVFDGAVVKFALAAAAASSGEIVAQVGVRRPDGAAASRCGVVTGSGALLDALRAAGGDLGAALDGLAAAGRVAEVDLGDLLCERADTAAGRAAAQAALLRSLTKPTDGWVARHLNRRVSRVVTRALLGTSVTPNQMTLVANALGFLGVVLVARATWWTLLAGAALVQVQSILDGCDGEIARLKFQGSKLGEWLDNVLDDTINIAYSVALGHAAAVLLGQATYRWLGLATGACYVIYNAVLYAHLWLVHGSGNPFLFRWWFQKQDAYLQQSLAGAGLGARVVGLFHAMGRRDLFLLAFLALCAARLPQVAVVWYATIALVSAVLALIHVGAGGLAHDPRTRRQGN